MLRTTVQDKCSTAHGRSKHEGGRELSHQWDKSRCVSSCISAGKGGGQVQDWHLCHLSLASHPPHPKHQTSQNGCMVMFDSKSKDVSLTPSGKSTHSMQSRIPATRGQSCRTTPQVHTLLQCSPYLPMLLLSLCSSLPALPLSLSPHFCACSSKGGYEPFLAMFIHNRIFIPTFF